MNNDEVEELSSTRVRDALRGEELGDVKRNAAGLLNG